jgi:hypothetical protein
MWLLPTNGLVIVDVVSCFLVAVEVCLLAVALAMDCFFMPVIQAFSHHVTS